MDRPTHSIDVERLARSWQVGREKMKKVANCLQFAFTDNRDFQYPIPLLSKVPKLDGLQSSAMLQGLVIGVADFGVFVDLGPECSGLIHISRLAPDFIEDPHQFVQVGDLIPVWVLNVDEKKKRVSLTAIPPGTPSRRDAHQGFENSQDRGENVGRDNRNQRNDRNQSGSRDGRPAPAPENRSPMPAGSGDNRGRGAAGGNRPGGGGDNRGGDSRGGGNRGASDNRGGRPTGRDNNRDRSRNNARSEDQGARRPTRVEPPKPVTPITDAMQTGKEPLRSFSDLLQFMKKDRDEPVVEKPVVVESMVVENVVERPASQNAETVEPGDGSNNSANENVVNRVESTERGDASDTTA